MISLEYRTHGVLLGKSQEQSGLYMGLTTLVNPESPPKRDHALPAPSHKPQGSGSWVGLPGFSKLSMQETCLGHLFKRLVPWNSPGKQLIQWVPHGVSEPQFLTNTLSPFFFA